MPFEVLLVWRVDSGAVVSPSSPEASRDDVCRAPSARLVVSAALAVFLLRLPLLEDPDGDDMLAEGVDDDRNKRRCWSGPDAA